MEISRFILLLCLPWSFLISGTNQLQSSQTQVLLQLMKQLEYPKQLENWANPETDPCFSSSPQANITCKDNVVTEVRIFGNTQTSPDNSPVSHQSLSRNFSIDSLVSTLSRLNQLGALSLVSLGIWGPIPDKIYRLQSLEYLDLSSNFLYGSIPQTLARIAKLRILKMDGNFLNGTLPDWFDSFSNLTSLSLSNNLFTGPLPSSILKITSLTDINLSNNAISGELLDLSSLTSLRWIDFSDNRLSSGLSSMPKDVTAVLLSNNSLSGKIPDQYGKLNQLRQLDLSRNALTDTAPDGLFTLPSITTLNLASNMLSGSLSHSSCGSKLRLLDISNNRLSGVLPKCLSSDVKNRVVKYDGNCLSSIDQQRQQTYCVENLREKNEPRRKSVGLLIGGVAVAVVLCAFGFVVLCRRYRPRETSERHLLNMSVYEDSVSGFTAEIITSDRFISDASKLDMQCLPAYRQFSLDELKAATNNFDKITLLGGGSSGKIYKGTLESGSDVAIRCLTVSRRHTIRNLKLRLDLLTRLRHPHLVCLLGHCIQGEVKDEYGDNTVYLIYEYVPSGTYRAHLSEANPENVLRWSDRLSILIGIAKAVHFLHTGIIPGFYNNRLKSNNILLNEHRIGKLSDYGLSVLAREIDKEGDGLRSWQMKSLEDDIYSFGFILLESLVGPSLLARNESFLQYEMVSLSKPDGQMRIVDPNVLSSCCRESLSIVVSLTINCISQESSTRPSFEDVLWNLQDAAQVQATSEDRTGKTL